MNTTVDAMLSYNLHLPQIFVYDDDEDGWAPVVSYRGLPLSPGDRLTVARRWRNIENNVSKEEIRHFIVVSRHIIISTDYSASGNTEREKWEIGARKANVDRMTIEETDGSDGES